MTQFDPLPNDDSAEELAALYALDILADDERAQAEAAMRVSKAFAQRVHHYQSAAAPLAYGAGPAAPSPDLKTRLFQRVQSPNTDIGDSLLALLDLSIERLKREAESLSWSPIVDGCLAETALWKTDANRREAACFVRTRQTCELPLHSHATGEMLLVLEGAFTSDGRRYEAGERVFFPPDSAHRPEAHSGCLVLCISSTDDRILAV